MSISNEILHKELFGTGLESLSSSLVANPETDLKHISAYRSFIRYNVVKQKKSGVLEEIVMDTLGKHLCETSTISYEAFKIISSMAPECARKFFSSKNFLLFPKDANQCIESEDFIRYIQRSIEIENCILNIMDFTPEMGGNPYTTTISEQQLNAYIFRLIADIDIGNKMHESFFEFYAYTASQKFTFFLDPRRSNQIPIKKLAHSSVMEELLFLRRLSQNFRNQVQSDNIVDDDLISDLALEFEAMAVSNWFSGNNAVKIYSLFLELDKDQNGMLSLEEIRLFTGFGSDQIQFTNLAWQRLFQENITFQPVELDYKGFVNLVLATENVTTPEAVRYFWRMIDYDRSGRLTAGKIKHFYKDIYDSLIASNYDAPNENHVVLEIYDILACNDEEGPTLDDLLSSKQGHTVLTMLLDINGFWKYDNRENLMAHPADDDDDEQQQQSITPPPPSYVAATKLSNNSGGNSNVNLAKRLSDAIDDMYDDEFESYDA